jgi:Ca2+-binding RTX toxin-like protein
VQIYTHVESFESRRLLSVTLNGGWLAITGTDAADVISVDAVSGATTVSVNGQQQVFNTPEVTSITIDGLGGDDEISHFDNLGAAIAAPTVHGGAGDDTIDINRAAFGGPGGDAYYFGDEGDDTFVSLRILTNRIFSGGPGTDSVSYAIFTSTGPISVSLDDLSGDGPLGGDNVRSDVEVVTGTIFNDTLTGSSHSETLIGGPGDDVITGGGNEDMLSGGLGNDTIVGSGSLDGGEGENSVTRRKYPWRINNIVALGIVGTPQDDLLTVRSLGANVLEVQLNENVSTVLIDQVTTVRIDGLAGDDRMVLRLDDDMRALDIRIYGSEGNDTIHGSDHDERVYGGEGNDWINANGGGDIVYGESGHDRLFGGDGKDYISGGAGVNVIRGEGGKDILIGDKRFDDLRNNAGDSVLQEELSVGSSRPLKR